MSTILGKPYWKDWTIKAHKPLRQNEISSFNAGVRNLWGLGVGVTSESRNGSIKDLQSNLHMEISRRHENGRAFRFPFRAQKKRRESEKMQWVPLKSTTMNETKSEPRLHNVRVTNRENIEVSGWYVTCFLSIHGFLPLFFYSHLVKFLSLPMLIGLWNNFLSKDLWECIH